MATTEIVYCFGCGEDMSGKSTNRYKMMSSSCARAIPVWKKKLNAILVSQGLDTSIDMEELINGGRMCRLCVSALERLDKLERSVMTNLSNAVQCVLDYQNLPISKLYLQMLL